MKRRSAAWPIPLCGVRAGAVGAFAAGPGPAKQPNGVFVLSSRPCARIGTPRARMRRS